MSRHLRVRERLEYMAAEVWHVGRIWERDARESIDALRSAATSLMDIADTIAGLPISYTTIVKEVARQWAITPQELLGASKARPAAEARQVAMTLLHETSGMSLVRIAKLFRRTCHGTSLHAAKMVRSLAATDPEFRTRLSATRSALAIPASQQ